MTEVIMMMMMTVRLIMMTVDDDDNDNDYEEVKGKDDSDNVDDVEYGDECGWEKNDGDRRVRRLRMIVVMMMVMTMTRMTMINLPGNRDLRDTDLSNLNGHVRTNSLSEARHLS